MKDNEFPLQYHSAKGLFYKRIDGKQKYFGSDREEALARYRDFLREAANATPAVIETALLDVVSACNLYLDHQERRVEREEISHRHFMDIKRTLKRFTEQIGPGKSVHSIAPDDFSAYRDTLYETMNSQTVNNNITRIKGLFHWLHKREYIARPQNFGDDFQKAKRRQLRRERRERGAMMFSAHQINDLLACSAPTLRAMILLGINCGYQGSDCEKIPESYVLAAIKSGWIDYPREKTEVERLAKLWPETIEALQLYHSLRRPPRKESCNRFFLRRNGTEFSRCNCDIQKLFNAAKAEAFVTRSGSGFSWLRKTFETIGQLAGEQIALDHIMGHADDSMAAVYRQKVFEKSVGKVTDTVHDWLLSDDDSL